MTFNPWTSLLEVINFVVLAYVLYRLLYRPLHLAIDRRREMVRQEQEEAAKARTEAELTKQKLQDQLAAIDQQRQEIINEARVQGEAERKHILDEAGQAAKRQQEQLQLSIAREREQMLQQLSGELVNHAVEIAERLLRQAVNSGLQDQLEQHLIEALNMTPENEKEQMRREWQTEDQAWLETAAKPDNTAMSQIKELVTQFAGKALAVNVQINPALIAGIKLRIGGHLWDASVLGQLESIHSNPTKTTNA